MALDLLILGRITSVICSVALRYLLSAECTKFPTKVLGEVLNSSHDGGVEVSRPDIFVGRIKNVVPCL